jgi:rubrerythrin
MKHTRIIFSIVLPLCLLFGCSQKKDIQTVDNLKNTYSHEMSSSIKYSKFADKAKEEGHESIARLFACLAKSEGVHADRIKEALGEMVATVDPPEIEKFDVLSTKQNLATAINDETFEIDTLYLAFTRVADREKCAHAKQVYTWLYSTENKHQAFLRDMLTNLMAGTESAKLITWYVCPVCGDTYRDPLTSKLCDYCGTGSEKFLTF